ncbi:MAG: transcriptional regulator, partial [Defluviitaleaceae bacterium]|nr:transcriptional regulator [Defluviitaleaceae bacterium]
RIYTENWNRSNEYGRIDPENFTPQSKNPIIAKFFMNIGRADQLGSGIRNLYKYTKLYSGEEPVLIEGDIFKTIIPLISASEKQANKTSGKNKRIKQANKTSEKKDAIVGYIAEHGMVTATVLTELFNLSEGRVRAILLEMVKAGSIKKNGKTKSVYYTLE